ARLKTQAGERLRGVQSHGGPAHADRPGWREGVVDRDDAATEVDGASGRELASGEAVRAGLEADGPGPGHGGPGRVAVAVAEHQRGAGLHQQNTAGGAARVEAERAGLDVDAAGAVEDHATGVGEELDGAAATLGEAALVAEGVAATGAVRL